MCQGIFWGDYDLPYAEKTKVCIKCGKEKPITSFTVVSRRKDGHNGMCKDCHNKRARGYYDNTYRDKGKFPAAHIRATRVCIDCGDEKPIGEFRNNRKGWYAKYCKVCSRKRDVKRGQVERESKVLASGVVRCRGICFQFKPVDDFSLNENTGERNERCTACTELVSNTLASLIQLPVSDGTKQCARCDVVKPIGDFRAYKAGYTERHCDMCRSRQTRMKTYGISVAVLLEVEAITACQVCGKKVIHYTKVKRDMANTDHCHGTEKLRGVLCTSCNTADRHPATLRKLADYFENPPFWNGNTP